LGLRRPFCEPPADGLEMRVVRGVHATNLPWLVTLPFGSNPKEAKGTEV